jgi:hypothetical protein
MKNIDSENIVSIKTVENVDWRFHLLLFAIAFIVISSRRPDAILNPQFWAEDGKYWYAEAYNQGIIRSLLLPHTGYLNTISRLTADLAQFFPFYSAPLLFNIVAIIIQILPVSILMSSRFSSLIPSRNMRIVLSIIYLALPGSAEINANLTNAQWHLALSAFMVVIAAPGKHLLWRYFDTGVIMLSGLSGPFSILLTPIIFIRWLLVREKRLWHLLLLTLLCALIQLSCLFLITEGRPQTELGASPTLLLNILSGKVFLIPLIGQRGVLLTKDLGCYEIIATIVLIIGILAIIKSLREGPLELTLFQLFAGLIFIAALVSPPKSFGLPWWNVLNIPFNCQRYWFMPNLAFLVALIWTLSKFTYKKKRMIAVLVCAIMAVGIILDWRHPSYYNFNFQENAQLFEEAPRTSIVTIPLNPPGWSMTLIKK